MFCYQCASDSIRGSRFIKALMCRSARSLYVDLLLVTQVFILFCPTFCPILFVALLFYFTRTNRRRHRRKGSLKSTCLILALILSNSKRFIYFALFVRNCINSVGSCPFLPFSCSFCLEDY